MNEGREMKIILRYCGLGAMLAGAAFCLPSCDGDNGTGPAPYDGPWKIVACPEGPPYLNGVYFLNADLGYTVGCEYILEYDGSNWGINYEYPEEEREINASFYDVWFNAPDDGWVIGSRYDEVNNICEGLIMRFDGVKWRELENIPGSGDWRCVFFLDENHGWVGGYGIARWDGNEWHYETDIGFITDIYFNTPTDGWAVAMHGERIYHYDGVTWNRVHDDPWGIELYSICFTRPDHGWAGGMNANTADESNIMEYRDGDWFPYLGAPWDEGIRRTVNAVHFSGPDNGWAVGQKTYRWDGERWWYVDSPRPETGTFTEVFAISDTDAWAVTEGAEILHYQP
jgi:hypothetical protein